MFGFLVFEVCDNKRAHQSSYQDRFVATTVNGISDQRLTCDIKGSVGKGFETRRVNRGQCDTRIKLTPMVNAPRLDS